MGSFVEQNIDQKVNSFIDVDVDVNETPDIDQEYRSDDENFEDVKVDVVEDDIGKADST